MLRLPIWAVALAVGLACLGVACGGARGPQPFRIGTVLPYTGDLGNSGPPMRNGADLAAELINDAGGVRGRPVRPVHRDSGTNPQVAIEAARALVNVQGVKAIVGAASSNETLAVAQTVTIPGGVVLVSPASTSPALTAVSDDDLLFRTVVSDAAQGAVLARLARELGYQTAAVIYVNNAYGEGLANVFRLTFEAQGGKVLVLVPQESGQASYLPELRRATQGRPEVLVAISYPESAGVYLREALDGGFINKFMFVDGTKNQDLFDRLGSDRFNGFYGTAPGTPESDTGRVFRQLYEERFGQLPTNPFIGESFDAFVLLSLAIQKSGKYEGPAIRDALREVANPPGEKVGPGDIAKALALLRDGKDIDYEGVAGSQNIDAHGDVANTIEIWKIEGGRITSTGRFEAP